MDPLAAVTLLLGILDRAAQVGAMIQKARAENRDITTEELDALLILDGEARQGLIDAIDAAKKAR